MLLSGCYPKSLDHIPAPTRLPYTLNCEEPIILIATASFGLFPITHGDDGLDGWRRVHKSDNGTSVVLELSEHRDMYSVQPGEFQEVISPKDYSVFTSADGSEVLHIKDSITGRYKQVVTTNMFPNQLVQPPEHLEADTDYEDARDTPIKTLLSLELPSRSVLRHCCHEVIRHPRADSV